MENHSRNLLNISWINDFVSNPAHAEGLVKSHIRTHTRVHIYIYIYSCWWPYSRGTEGFLFNSYYNEVFGGRSSFSRVAPLYLDTYLTMLSVKQEGIKLQFLRFWYDSARDRTSISQAIGEIPPEVWKTRQFDDILLRHCNAVYNQNPIDRWMKGCILPFPKKGDLGLAKDYRGITLTSIAAKIYNALLRNRIEPKIDNILRKNQNGFRRNRSTTSQILTIRRILEGVRAKNLQATLIFVDFTKAFDSIHRGKMEQILLAYGIPKETVAAITILYGNTKVKVRSPDGDTEYFDIVAGVLQGDTLALYLFIICLDYVLRTSIDKIKENGFELTKKRSRRYPATTITDADYADDIAILANTPD